MRNKLSFTHRFGLFILLVLLRLILSLRYRVKVKGLDNILTEAQKQGRSCLFLPNHPALIDPIILYSILGPKFQPRPLSDEGQANRPGLRYIFKKIINVIIIPDVGKEGRLAREGVMQALNSVASALAEGENVMLYPSGHILRNQYEKISGNSGLEIVLRKLKEQAANMPLLVLVRTSNLWGSRFSRAWGVYPSVATILMQSLKALAANLLFFIPKHNVEVELKLEPEFDRLAENLLNANGLNLQNTERKSTELKEPNVLNAPNEANGFSNLSKRQALNEFLENYYNQTSSPATYVPLYFWQGSSPRPLEVLPTPSLAEAGEAAKTELTGLTSNASNAVWEQVREHLAEISGQTEITPKTNLAADLDMDSLAIAELSVWLEAEFGHSVDELENLISVQDVLNATQGRMAGKNAEKRVVPKAWLNKENARRLASKRLGLPTCPNLGNTAYPSLLSLFLAQARKHPSTPVVLDYSSGLSSLRKLLLSVEALHIPFKKLAGERIGIMLPCSTAVLSTYYATLAAGKTPVMVNWTLGVGNIKHCLNLAETETIITARALTKRLVRQGFNIDAITTLAGKPIQWIFLEDVAAQIKLGQKLAAMARTLFSRHLDKLACRLKAPLGEQHEQSAHVEHYTHTCVQKTNNCDGVSEIAAILFTSGSEALPKAVPLTHANIVANLSDVAEILNISAADRILGMLPPFHSLGLIANVALPLAYALPMACHPNPTEAAPLVNLTQECALTILATPPSFLAGMLDKAKNTQALSSVRLAFVGAEKCPEHVFAEFTRQCPQGALCEGYGVTECSPVISVNRPENIHLGTIGQALPSVHTAVVVNFENPDSSKLTRAKPNQTGMLLVRGASVFSGYLPPPIKMQNLGVKIPPSPFVFFENENWYSTGDLVSKSQDGIITFQGRLKRFIKLGGEMISLPQIEGVLLATFEGEEVKSSEGNPEEKPEANNPSRPASPSTYSKKNTSSSENNGPILAVEASADDNPEIVLITTKNISREQANAALRAAGLSGLHSIRRVQKVQSIPVLGTGKTDYRLLKQQI